MPEFKLKGLFDLSEGSGKGKSTSALLLSRDKKEAMVSLFGRNNLPASVMRAEVSRDYEESDAVTHNGRRYEDTSTKYTKGMAKPLKKSGFAISSAGAHSGALSIFPQNIGRTVLLLYSEPGDLVVDPFAGHNSRMELCVSNGRQYEGCDLSTKFMEFNRKRAAQLEASFTKARIKLHHCDSRKMPVKSGAGDFTITSPPYYDIEFYGDEKEQLGKSKTYDAFLDGLSLVMKENFRCLKPGAFAAWFVNDFRRKGIFHPYHMHTASLAIEAGFILHDLLIVDFGRSFGQVFFNQYIEYKLLPKQHEYGLIFRKPGGNK